MSGSERLLDDNDDDESCLRLASKADLMKDD